MKITFYASTNEVLSELGRRIKAARIALPATQKEMAEMTNLSQKTISNLETGKDVSFSTVVEVLRALGLFYGGRGASCAGAVAESGADDP